MPFNIQSLAYIGQEIDKPLRNDGVTLVLTRWSCAWICMEMSFITPTNEYVKNFLDKGSESKNLSMRELYYQKERKKNGHKYEL